MPLTQSQKTIWERARSLGSGGQAIRLDDEACTYLIARIAADLGVIRELPELPEDVADFYNSGELSDLRIAGLDALGLFQRLLEIDPNVDTYFACLASLHKARLKYENILETQPIPTLEQVGPRGLLQFGKMSSKELAAFLFWRKWFFDIDNRAGQETGYLFEPVIANAIGGTPVSAARSPVKRRSDSRKGRQVDCLLGKRAYELKIRMTIAASGQGRWGEELDFPLDCVASDYVPVLLVLDSTTNPKLTELTKAFLAQGGEVYIGEDAWAHLDKLAGPTMANFIDRYVREPLASLLSDASEALEPFAASFEGNELVIQVGDEAFKIQREQGDEANDGRDRADNDSDADL
jgi:hypothetical protein